MTCVVCAASPADAATLSAFGRRVYAATFAADNDPAQLATYLDAAYTPEAQAAELADDRIRTLLARGADDAIVGFAQVRRGPVPDCVPDPEAIELWRFYVDPAWHGRGVARLLMEAALDLARATGGDARAIWLGVWERNARAQAFYRKCGFVPVGTHVFMFGTEPQTDEVWTRPLR